MKSEIKIRPGKPADLETIAMLWLEFMDFHRQRDPHFTRSADGHERFKEFLAGHMQAETSSVLVAERDGCVVGYCLATLAKYPPVFANRDHGTVFDLAVTQRCRRSGIGEQLYRATEAWFTAHGIHRIETRVAVTNETSTAFWSKMDFAPYMMTVAKCI